jgi:hypothetical protein
MNTGLETIYKTIQKHTTHKIESRIYKTRKQTNKEKLKKQNN